VAVLECPPAPDTADRVRDGRRPETSTVDPIRQLRGIPDQANCARQACSWACRNSHWKCWWSCWNGPESWLLASGCVSGSGRRS